MTNLKGVANEKFDTDESPIYPSLKSVFGTLSRFYYIFEIKIFKLSVFTAQYHAKIAKYPTTLFHRPKSSQFSTIFALMSLVLFVVIHTLSGVPKNMQ